MITVIPHWPFLVIRTKISDNWWTWKIMFHYISNAISPFPSFKQFCNSVKRNSRWFSVSFPFDCFLKRLIISIFKGSTSNRTTAVRNWCNHTIYVGFSVTSAATIYRNLNRTLCTSVGYVILKNASVTRFAWVRNASSKFAPFSSSPGNNTTKVRVPWLVCVVLWSQTMIMCHNGCRATQLV